jgi:hypothetical protein
MGRMEISGIVYSAMDHFPPPQEIIEKIPTTKTIVRKKTRISPEVRLVSMKDMFTPYMSSTKTS